MPPGEAIGRPADVLLQRRMLIARFGSAQNMRVDGLPRNPMRCTAACRGLSD
jgi:hypothetical protein